MLVFLGSRFVTLTKAYAYIYIYMLNYLSLNSTCLTILLSICTSGEENFVCHKLKPSGLPQVFQFLPLISMNAYHHKTEEVLDLV